MICIVIRMLLTIMISKETSNEMLLEFAWFLWLERVSQAATASRRARERVAEVHQDGG